jgi:hypothetical protein
MSDLDFVESLSRTHARFGTLAARCTAERSLRLVLDGYGQPPANGREAFNDLLQRVRKIARAPEHVLTFFEVVQRFGNIAAHGSGAEEFGAEVPSVVLPALRTAISWAVTHVCGPIDTAGRPERASVARSYPLAAGNIEQLREWLSDDEFSVLSAAAERGKTAELLGLLARLHRRPPPLAHSASDATFERAVRTVAQVVYQMRDPRNFSN